MEKFQDRVEIQTQDLLTSQTLLPLSHLIPGRGVEDKLRTLTTLPRDLSQIPTDSHSLNYSP